MNIDFASLDIESRYRLVAGLVVPRPIALVTTVGENGVVNAAPFSHFNVVGHDPLLIVLGIAQNDDGSIKDTARNLIAKPEFVVNLVDESIAAATDACGVPHPPEISEVDPAGLTLAASRLVKAPRIAEAPAALECRVHTHLPFAKQHLFLGEVLGAWARDGLVDPFTQMTLPAYAALGRLSGGRYCRIGDNFKA